MKTAVFGAIVLSLLAVSRPASAQFGGIMDKVQKGQDAKQKLDSLNISDEEERKIGLDVSQKVRARFGVVQDAAVHKYVSLVGLTLAAQTERPNLQWTFIVLDTDGVNAFAAPGGFVHITRGALGLMKNEGELAAVLGHEMGHVVRKHTINAIKKANAEKMASEAALADRGPYLNELADKAYDSVLEGKFDRNDELDADRYSVTITQRLGYASGALADFLTRLDDRNKNQPTRNGLFASHPDMKERIQKIRQLAGNKGGAIDAPRYAANITYHESAITSIAVIPEGSSGLAGSTADSSSNNSNGQNSDGQNGTDQSAQSNPPPKKGFGLGALKKSTGNDNQSAQVSASGGARGVGPDRLAKGGSNPALVPVTITPAELTAFKQGIA